MHKYHMLFEVSGDTTVEAKSVEGAFTAFNNRFRNSGANCRKMRIIEIDGQRVDTVQEDNR